MTDLPSGWPVVALGEVALNSTVVSADPEAEGFERYIIGKHIPVDGDRVTTWGMVGDSDFGPRIRTVFQPGDVICTTRGPNLKIARVDFWGLGAHTNFVLRTADPDVLVQPYLEAVVRSDGFQRHLATSFRGSVNLFVNWSDAAKYEFVLPPLAEQRRAAELLQALDEATGSYSSAIALLREVQQAHLILAPGHAVVALGDVASFVTKGTTPSSVNRDYVGQGIPYLRAEDIVDADVDLARCEKFIDRETHDLFSRSKIQAFDVLLTIAGTIGRVGLVPAGVKEANCNQAVAIIRFPRALEAEFAAAWLRTADAQSQIRGGRVTGTISNLSLGEVKSLQMPVVSEADMKRHLVRDRLLSSRRDRLQRRSESIARMKSHTLRSLTSDERDA